MTERVFDYVGGHINDQSELQRVRFQSLSSADAHQDREMEALRLQTQQLSVRFLQLLGDHLSLIHHVRVLQDVVATDDFSGPAFHSPLFRPLREMMDKGKALPPSPPVTPTPTHPHCQDYDFHARFFTFILFNSLHFR